MSNELTITTHFPDTDPDFEGDYYDIEVKLTLNGSTYTKGYGDWYHDHGYDKAEGFTDAIRLLYHDIKVTEIDVADREEM